MLRGKENPFQERALFYLGESYDALGKDSRALESMRQLLAKYPLSGYAGLARLQMGRSWKRLGRWPAARDCFEKISAQYDGKPVAGWARVELANRYRADGDTAKVVALLTSMTSQPTNPLKPGELELWLANSLHLMGRNDEARSWYDKASDKTVSDAIRERALFGKAKMLSLRGDQAGAMELYEALLTQYASGSMAGWARVALARLKMEGGDAKGARKLAAEVSTKDAGRLAQARDFLMCQIAWEEKDYASAVTLYRKFLAFYPWSPYADSIRYSIALALFHSGKYAEAIAAAEESLAIGKSSPINRRAMLLKGDALNRLSRTQDAIAQYRMVMQEYAQDPKQDELLLRLGECLTQMKRWDEAVPVWEKLVQGFGQSRWAPLALFRLGLIRVELGDYSKAAHYFHEAAEKSPQGIVGEQARYQEGSALHKLGKFDQALVAYQRLLQIVPQGAGGTMREKAGAEMAWTLAAAFRDKEAAEIFQMFLKEFPSSPVVPQALFWLGQERLGQNDFAASAALFEKLLRDYPQSDLADDALFCSALGLARSGRHEESNAMFQKLLAQYPLSDLRWDVLFACADNEAAMKHYARAIAQFSSLLAEQPRSPRAPVAHLRMGDCYFARGDFRQALGIYSRWEDASDDAIAAQARFKKAIVREALGDREMAKQDLLGVFYAPTPVAPWAGKAGLKLGEMLEREGRAADAQILYEKLGTLAGEEGATARAKKVAP